MRRLAGPPLYRSFVVMAAATLLGGCAENSLALKSQLSQVQQSQQAMSSQNQQLEGRVSGLSDDNQELVSELGQTRRQAKAAEDQLVAVKGQLRTALSQLGNVRAEKQNRDKQVQALTASMRRQGGTSIRPNSSLSQTLPTISPADGYARSDGDVIRVALFGSRLFEADGIRLRAGAAELIADVSAQLARIHGDRIIGIEGHTDMAPLTSRQFRSHHALSVAQASAVHDVIAGRTQFGQGQLFVSGYGPNYPTHSNASPEGRLQNHRVELVVYPDRVGER